MLSHGLRRDLVQRGDFRLRQPQLSAQFAQDELGLSVRGGVEDEGG